MYKDITKIAVYIFIVLGVLFSACESKDIYYDLSDTENILVVYCLFNPDSVWKASVSKLDSLLGTSSDSNLWITNAEILLYEGNDILDTLELQKNNEYVSLKGLKPEYNKQYMIQIKCQNYNDMFSDYQSLPEPIVINSVDYLDYLPEDTYPNELYLDQESNQTIYHSISVNLNNESSGQYYKVFTSDKQFENRGWGNLSETTKDYFVEYYSWNCSILESLSSGNLTLEMAFTPYNAKLLNIYTINETYTLYEISYAEYDNDITLTYLLNSYNIYTNLDGGIGLFAGYTSNVIDLTKFNE